MRWSFSKREESVESKSLGVQFLSPGCGGVCADTQVFGPRQARHKHLVWLGTKLELTLLCICGLENIQHFVRNHLCGCAFKLTNSPTERFNNGLREDGQTCNKLTRKNTKFLYPEEEAGRKLWGGNATVFPFGWENWGDSSSSLPEE